MQCILRLSQPFSQDSFFSLYSLTIFFILGTFLNNVDQRLIQVHNSQVPFATVIKMITIAHKTCYNIDKEK